MHRVDLGDEYFVHLPARQSSFLHGSPLVVTNADVAGSGEEGVLVRGVVLQSTPTYVVLSCGGLYAKLPRHACRGPTAQGCVHEFFVCRGVE